MTTLERAVRDHEVAMQIISTFLREIRPSYEPWEAVHDAAALLARLASAKPPILLTSEEQGPVSMTLPLLTQILSVGLPRPVAEHEFCPGRKWRFDYAFIDARLGVEVDGGTRKGGRHNRHQGYSDDCEKLNNAVLLGWRCLRFTTEQVAGGYALATIQKALEKPC
jgi:hypothetical protein